MFALSFQQYLKIAMIVLYILVIGGCFLHREHPALKLNVRFSRDDVRRTALLLVALLLLLLIGNWLSFIHFVGNPSITVVAATALYMALLIAPAEELIFRGILLSKLLRIFHRSRARELIAVTLSSALFGLAHLPNGATGLQIAEWNWKLMVVAAIGGLFFGYNYLYTKSILHPIALHSIIGVLYFCFFAHP